MVPHGVENVHASCVGKSESDHQGINKSLKLLEKIKITIYYIREPLL